MASSTRFATFLRVTPIPKTIAESSAIFKHLKTRGRVLSFIRAPHREQDGCSASYYAVFSGNHPVNIEQNSSFDVPVYHNLPKPRDEDPFNIRGLQSRKPFPQAVTFKCTIEGVEGRERATVDESIKKENPFHGHFKTLKADQDWLQEVLQETGTPFAIVKALGHRVDEKVWRKEACTETTTATGAGENMTAHLEAASGQEGNVKTAEKETRPRPSRKRRIKMDSLIKMNNVVD